MQNINIELCDKLEAIISNYPATNSIQRAAFWIYSCKYNISRNYELHAMKCFEKAMNYIIGSNQRQADNCIHKRLFVVKFAVDFFIKYGILCDVNTDFEISMDIDNGDT